MAEGHEDFVPVAKNGEVDENLRKKAEEKEFKEKEKKAVNYWKVAALAALAAGLMFFGFHSCSNQDVKTDADNQVTLESMNSDSVYTEITEELEKLPALPYQAEVLKNINISLKKKISQQIIRGAGDSNTFTGIFSDKAVALADQKEFSIAEITDTTLDDIIFAYGGDEEVEGGAVLILNKNDLRAFAKLRTKEGRKVHIIDYKACTIDGIPYVINSHCKAISDPSTNEGEYSIAYGALSNYEVPIFSGVEIGKSTDYKFKDGIICYKASVFTGGNVVGYNGFLRVKKGAVANATTTEEE